MYPLPSSHSSGTSIKLFPHNKAEAEESDDDVTEDVDVTDEDDSSLLEDDTTDDEVAELLAELPLDGADGHPSDTKPQPPSGKVSQ